MIAKIFREIITSSKTNSLSSMRLITLTGSFAMIVSILFMVFSNDSRLNETLPYFTWALLGLSGAKAVQSKFEK